MGNIIEARVKTSASIRPSIWNRVQRAALERRTSASDVLEEALEEWLGQNCTGNFDENTIQSKPLEARHEKLLVEMRDLAASHRSLCRFRKVNLPLDRAASTIRSGMAGSTPHTLDSGGDTGDLRPVADGALVAAGAINDEVGVCDGGEFYIRNGTVLEMPDDDKTEVLEKYGFNPQSLKDGAIRVEALWCKEDDYSWTYRCDHDHSTFDILEDGEKYCRGIVLKL